MKSLFLAGAVALAIAGAAAAQPAPAEVKGDWQGAISVEGRALPIVVHLGDEITGDSPAEDRYGIAGKLETAGGKYKVSFISGSVIEVALKDGKLEGVLTSGQLSAPLVLERKPAEKK